MKWKLYARAIYWYEFFFLFLLMGAFLTEVFWLHYSKVSEVARVYKDRNKANVLFNE